MTERIGVLRAALGTATVASGAVLFALMLGAAAVVEPIIPVAAMLGLGFVALAFTNLAAGLAVFTVLMFTEQVPALSGGGFGPIKLAGGVLALSWFLVSVSRRSRTPLLVRDRPVLAYAALLFVVWAAISRVWAIDIGSASGNAVRLALGVGLLFIVFSAIEEPEHVRWVLWAYVAGGVLCGLIGIPQSSSGGGPYGEESRLEAAIDDPNELAALLVPAFVFAAFGVSVVRGLLPRTLLLASIVVIALTLFLTESRGGLAGLIVACIGAALFAGPIRGKVLTLIAVVATLGVGYYAFVASPESVDRILNPGESGGTGRTDLWSIAAKITSDHPLVGVGLGNFPVVEPLYASGTLNLPNVAFVVDTPKVAHNTYLEILSELGIVGFVFFAVLILAPLALGIRAVRRLARSGDVQMEVLARALIVGTAGMLTALLFISGEYEKHLWLLLGLAAALGTIVRAPVATDPAAPG